MAAKKYIDSTGLATLWEKIKNTIEAQTIGKIIAIRPRAKNPILIINPLNPKGDSQLNSHTNIYADSTLEYEDILTVGDGITGALDLKIGNISHILYPSMTNGGIEVYLPKESGELALVSTINTMGTDIKSLLSSTYATKIDLSNGLNGKANSSHSHTVNDVSNLQSVLDGKAESSHNHSASNITSGTLPITRGGTGQTTALGALKVLLNNATTSTSDTWTDNQLIVGSATSTNLFSDGVYKKTALSLWNYINSKISSSLGITSTNYANKRNITNGNFDPSNSDKDWNTLTTPGAYKIQTTADPGKFNASNSPDVSLVNGYGVLIVEDAGNNRIIQKYYPDYYDTIGKGTCWREFDANTWRAWIYSKDFKTLAASEGTADVKDETLIVTSNANGYSESKRTIVARKATYLWNYIKSKINSSRMNLTKDYYVHGGLEGTTATSGYIHFCTITVSKTYANEPFAMFISSRNRLGKLTIHLGLGNSTTISSPKLTWENHEFFGNSYLTTKPIWYKYSDNNLYLYYSKAESYDTMTVNRLEIGQYMYSHLSFSWNNTLVTSKDGLTNATLHTLYDESGNKVSTSYLPLAGGTMGGSITMNTGNIITPGNDSYGMYPATNNTGKIGKAGNMYFKGYFGELRISDEIEFMSATGTNAEADGNSYDYKIETIPGRFIQVKDSVGSRDVMGSICKSYTIPAGSGTCEKVLTIPKKMGCKIRQIVIEQNMGANVYAEFIIWVSEKNSSSGTNIVISKIFGSPKNLSYTFNSSTRTLELYDISEAYTWSQTLIVEPFMIPGNELTMYNQATTRTDSSTLSLTKI